MKRTHHNREETLDHDKATTDLQILASDLVEHVDNVVTRWQNHDMWGTVRSLATCLMRLGSMATVIYGSPDTPLPDETFEAEPF